MDLPIKIRHDAQTPIYLQIMYQLSYLITSSQLKVGQQLPTVREVAEALRVNTGTVARAYRDLRDQGLVESTTGSGTFVAPIASGTLDSAVRQGLLATAMRRAIDRAHSLGFSEGEMRQSFEAEMDVRQRSSTIMFAAPTIDVAHKYAVSLERRLHGSVRVVPVTFTDLTYLAPHVLLVLDLAYFVITFARFVRSVELSLAAAHQPSRVVGVGTVVQPVTVAALRTLQPSDRLCLVTSEPLVDMSLNLIAEHSQHDRRDITVYIDGSEDASIESIERFDKVLYSFSESDLLDRIGVPEHMRLELQFDVTEDSLERLRSAIGVGESRS